MVDLIEKTITLSTTSLSDLVADDHFYFFGEDGVPIPCQVRSKPAGKKREIVYAGNGNVRCWLYYLPTAKECTDAAFKDRRFLSPSDKKPTVELPKNTQVIKYVPWVDPGYKKDF